MSKAKNGIEHILEVLLFGVMDLVASKQEAASHEGK
jgi:hypothetical protein